MDVHQFVAELVLMGGSHTEREEGRATDATRNRGPKIPVARERGVAGSRSASKKSDWSLATAPAINAELVETVDAIVLR
jgi:hypothetical protein